MTFNKLFSAIFLILLSTNFNYAQDSITETAADTTKQAQETEPICNIKFRILTWYKEKHQSSGTMAAQKSSDDRPELPELFYFSENQYQSVSLVYSHYTSYHSYKGPAPLKLYAIEGTNENGEPKYVERMSIRVSPAWTDVEVIAMANSPTNIRNIAYDTSYSNLANDHYLLVNLSPTPMKMLLDGKILDIEPWGVAKARMNPDDPKGTPIAFAVEVDIPGRGWMKVFSRSFRAQDSRALVLFYPTRSNFRYWSYEYIGL